MRIPERLTSLLLALFVALLVAVCGAPQADGEASSDTIARAAPGLETASRPGIRFDPDTIRVGARVGSLVLDSIAVRHAIVDSVAVGTARFAGAIELSGATMRHPDPDAPFACFEADDPSASRLPRWQGDERRAWFCFENGAEAARALGPPSDGVAATIEIDRFTIHRGLSDEVNSARFVRLVGGGAAAEPGP